MTATPAKRPPILYIPGPVEVPPDVLAAMARPLIGHRGAEHKQLVDSLQRRLAHLIGCRGPMILLAASATGAMEGAMRCLVQRRALMLVAGPWGAKFAEVGRANGTPLDTLEVPAGEVVTAAALEAALARGDYDVVALVHNDTATGAMMPLAEVARVVKADPARLLVVDAVSSMAAVPIDMAALGIDCCFAGTQKAFACPPGITVLGLSDAALARAREVPNRGLYFDFVKLAASAAKQETLTTPPISLLFALDVQLNRILAEGMEARHARHVRMAEQVRSWAISRGFGLFAAEGHRSITLTTIANTRGIDVPGLVKALVDRHGVRIGNGYKDLADKTFRIAHMGEHMPDEIGRLLGYIDEIVGRP